VHRPGSADEQVQAGDVEAGVATGEAVDVTVGRYLDLDGGRTKAAP